MSQFIYTLACMLVASIATLWWLRPSKKKEEHEGNINPRLNKLVAIWNVIRAREWFLATDRGTQNACKPLFLMLVHAQLHVAAEKMGVAQGVPGFGPGPEAGEPLSKWRAKKED